MASTKLKIAYVSFFASFAIWLSLLFYVCLPSGVWVTPIKFPNSASFILFFGSALVAVISCLFIGLNNIGLYPKFRSKSKEAPKTLGLNKTVISQMSNAPSLKKEKLNVPTAEEEETKMVVLPQLEGEQQVAS